MKRTFEEMLNRVTKLSDAVFGEYSEVDELEAEELLGAAGVEQQDFELRLYKQLYGRAQRYWIEQKPLPSLLKKALEDLRPANAPARNEKELVSQARSIIEHMLEKAKLLSQLVSTDQDLSFATSYRTKSELSTEDKSILDSTQQTLRDKIKKSGDLK